MEYYQLRLPTELGVLGLADSLIFELEAAFLRLNIVWRSDSPIDLEQAIRSVLDRYLVAYDSCGSSCRCDEAVEPVAWNVNPDPRLISSDDAKNDAFLRLQFRFSADEFYKFSGLVTRIASSQTDVGEDRALLVQEELEKTIFSVFSAYLFDAPTCRKQGLCNTGRELDIWSANNPDAIIFS